MLATECWIQVSVPSYNITVNYFKGLLLLCFLFDLISQFKDPWKLLDPHDPGLGKNVPFKKGGLLLLVILY